MKEKIPASQVPVGSPAAEERGHIGRKRGRGGKRKGWKEEIGESEL